MRSKEQDSGNRWILTFSEYAEVDVADAWPGYRNPVFYTDLENFGIDVNALQFQPMPKQETEVKSGRQGEALTLAEAKEGLALTFGVAPSDIEITVRG